jgi:small-conductance mechanosensitive channel
MMVAMRKMRLRKTIANQAHVTNRKDHPALLAADAAEAAYRGFAEVETTVGVTYSSDLAKVRQTLESVCDGLDWASSQHKPAVLLSGFGDSALTFKVRVWIEDPWDAGSRRASLNETIWWGLKKAGIVIAFPQLDVHFDRERPMLTPERTP